MPTPSWDLAITVFFLIGIVFGYILQRDKIVATLLSVYVGLIVTQAVSGNVHQFFQGDTTLFNQVWIRSNTNLLTIRIIVFAGVIMLLSAKTSFSAGRSKGILSPIEIIVYSTLTSGLILSSIFYFMPPETRNALMASSRMAKLLIGYYTWWIVLPVIFMIVTGFFHKGSSSSSD